MDIKIAQQMTITELVLENQKLKLDAQREAEHHDKMVGELEKVYAERDEAREKAERYRLEANAMMLQRDEARSELSLKQQTLTIAEGTLSDLRKELKEWQTLCSWGGTPEHIHDFIKGQQTRIHQAQDIEKTCEQLEHSRDEWSAMCGRYKQERDQLLQKLDAWEEIAEHLHHLVQHPAYGVDQAIRRMDVLEAYKHLKNGH